MCGVYCVGGPVAAGHGGCGAEGASSCDPVPGAVCGGSRETL